MTARSLTGQTALVTGAAKRIGRAISLALAGEGVNIVVHYRASQSEATDLLNELTAKGVSAWAVRADFEKPEEYQTLVQRAIDAAGSLDILINNASIFPPDTLDTVTFESLKTNIEVNAWVPFVLSRDFAKLAGGRGKPNAPPPPLSGEGWGGVTLNSQPSTLNAPSPNTQHLRGKIINLIDSRVTDADWNHVGYMLSKHVLAALTDMTALAYAPDIAVNAIAPGLILPPPGKDQSYIERLADTVPLKRHGEPEDIAEAAVFLAKSEFLTGEVIYVDGGRHLKEYRNG